MRGGLLEAGDRGRWGEHLEEVKRQERHDRRDPGNTGPTGTDSLGAQILEAVRPIRSPSWQVVDGSLRKRQGGQVASRDAPATGEGNPLKTKAQGRYRHETRPERLRAEQGVKRLRKPEGAAQPGVVGPVQVAARFCKRRRARNPMGGPPVNRTLYGPGVALADETRVAVFTPRRGRRAGRWQHRPAPGGRPQRLWPTDAEIETGFQ